MHLDELRSLLLSERESGRLSVIPFDLYDSTQKEIKNLTKEVYEIEDPFSDRARSLIEKVASFRETLEEIYRLRSQKILELARVQSEATYFDKEEVKRMVSRERELFDEVRNAVERSKSQLLLGLQIDKHDSETLSETRTEGETVTNSRDIDETTLLHPYSLVRVIADMDPFMGIDGKTYNLAKGDIVTLPLRNAEVLIERNIVLNIQLYN